jgi:membrane-bound serine protease (ClpP class)
MVDEDVTVDSVNKEGKLITLTTTEAMKFGFCEGEVGSLQELLKVAGIEDYEIIEVQKNSIDNAIGFLMHPGVSGVLVLLIFLGIYYELQAPGIGFPTLIAIGAALLYFAPLYLEGLAANWEILLFVGGLALLMVELFAIPGFGVTGIAGIVLIFVSLVLSLVRNVNFDFSGTGEGDLGNAVIRITVSLVAFMVFLFFFGAAFFRSKFFNRLVLSDDLSEARMNTISGEKQGLTGKQGTCFDNLRPQGKVKIEDTIYPATSLGGFIDKGTAVTVIREEAGMLVVRVS